MTVGVRIDGTNGYMDKKSGFRYNSASGASSKDVNLEASLYFRYDTTDQGGGTYNLIDGWFVLHCQDAGMGTADYTGILNTQGSEIEVTDKKFKLDLAPSAVTPAFSGDEVWGPNGPPGTPTTNPDERRFVFEAKGGSNTFDPNNVGDLTQNTGITEMKIKVYWRGEEGGSPTTNASGKTSLQFFNPPSNIPEPASIATWMGLICLCGLRRRSR